MSVFSNDDRKATFQGATLLITGGTGSFGGTLVEHLKDFPFREIRIFSRDEKKQDDMRRQHNSSALKFYIGDVRDPQSIAPAMDGVDFVFHAAALKQVPSCEFHPLEAVKTNVLGTANVLEAASRYCASRVVCLSTDKAVYPINAMGISKALMEKVSIAKARVQSGGGPVICTTRYGNVIASRGSVIPHFIRQVKAGLPISITDPQMTRFMMSLDDAVELVLYAFERGASGDLFVQKAPAATIGELAKAVLELLDCPNHPIEIIGTRHGEKLYETLLSREELVFARDLGDYYCVSPDMRDLNYEKYINRGEEVISRSEDYNSHNTNRLSHADLVTLLRSLSSVRRLVSDSVEELT